MPVRNRPQKLKKILFSKLKNLENLEILNSATVSKNRLLDSKLLL